MKVYDCFTFFNELDLLEIRLNTLNDVVEKFVLVEATQTHSGRKKPLYFEENKRRFNKFLHKIIHIIVEFPPHLNDSWKKENYQRNQILQGLKDADPDDLIIISDIDEIPKPNTLKEIKNIKTDSIYILNGDIFYFFINYKAFINDKSLVWSGPVICKRKFLSSPQNLRNLAIFQEGIEGDFNYLYKIKCFVLLSLNKFISSIPINVINDSQWHFSYLGGKEVIRKKLESFAHTEPDKENFKSDEYLDNFIKNGRFFTGNIQLKKVDVDDSFPEYIRSNLKKFRNLIFY